MLRDEGECVDRRHRPGEEKALDFAKTFAAQPRQLIRRLDAFSRRRQVEAGAEAGYRLDDRHRARIGADAGNEAAVHLDLVEGEGAQIAQRRVACAEIVHGDAHAEVAQRMQELQVLPVLREQHGFGDLELKPARMQPRLVERGDDRRQQADLLELAGRQVDGDLDVARPARCRAAGLPEHPFAEVADQAGLLGHGDEFGRTEQAALWMTPAHQRLEARDAVVGQRQHRLVVQFELLGGQRLAQFESEPVAALRVEAHGVLVETEGGAAVRLGCIERKVGVAQQRVDVVAVLGGKRDADAAIDMFHDAVEVKRF